MKETEAIAHFLAMHVLLLVYTVAFTIACVHFGGTSSPTYASMGVAVSGGIMVYAEMNKRTTLKKANKELSIL